MSVVIFQLPTPSPLIDPVEVQLEQNKEEEDLCFGHKGLTIIPFIYLFTSWADNS